LARRFTAFQFDPKVKGGGNLLVASFAAEGPIEAEKARLKSTYRKGRHRRWGIDVVLPTG